MKLKEFLEQLGIFGVMKALMFIHTHKITELTLQLVFQSTSEHLTEENKTILSSYQRWSLGD